MVHVVIYWSLLLSTFAYAWAKGGAPERWGASMLAAASLASMFALSPLPERYRSIENGVALSDAALLLGYLVLALRSTRYWPSWLVALQVVQLGSDFAAVLPNMLVMVCGIMISTLGYPMIIVIAVGTLRHRKRLALALDERPWVGFSNEARDSLAR